MGRLNYGNTCSPIRVLLHRKTSEPSKAIASVEGAALRVRLDTEQVDRDTPPTNHKACTIISAMYRLKEAGSGTIPPSANKACP